MTVARLREARDVPNTTSAAMDAGVDRDAPGAARERGTSLDARSNAMPRSVMSVPRVVFVALLMSSAMTGHAAPASVCPPRVGERDQMLATLRYLGHNDQVARRCAVPEAQVQAKVDRTLATMRACLEERGIGEMQIRGAIDAGTRDGDALYTRATDRAALCDDSRADYKAP